MSGWLLDTNVVSELRRPKPDKRVVAFVAGNSADQLFLSVVTIVELRFGIESLSESEQRTTLAKWLDHQIRPQFAGRILPLDESTLLRWRLTLEARNKQGQSFTTPDLLIAVTALEHDLVVASRDVRPFERAGVPVLNPWLS